jgi:uncharacterized protein YggT (Ycf19 family)
MFRSRDDVAIRREPLDRDAQRQRVAARVSGVISFVFGIIYTIICVRLVLEALGAREGNAFKEFVDQLSAPVLGVFEGLLPSIFVGRYEFVMSYVFALAIYALVHYGIRRLIWGMARPRP